MFLTKNSKIYCSKELQNFSSTQQDFLIHYINSATTTCEVVTIESAKSKQVAAFKCWRAFLLKVGIQDTYLIAFSKFQQNITMSAFAQAMWEVYFSPTNRNTLVEGTVNATFSYVAQAFRSNNRSDPRLDIDNKICFILHEQFRAYYNQDGPRRKLCLQQSFKKCLNCHHPI